MLAEWGLCTVRSKSWNLEREKCVDSARSSERSVVACEAGR